MSLDPLHADWTVWSDEPARVVLAYRPDVFDGEEFPPACLPTIYLTRGRRDRRPGGQRVGEDWHVTLALEPDVECKRSNFESRPDAIAGALDLARTFADGGIDYRSHYQVPRTAYFDRLDELTGQGDPE